MAAAPPAAGRDRATSFYRVNQTYLAILRVLWDAGEPRTVRQVFEELYARGPCSFATVATTLRAMAMAGLLKQTRRRNRRFFAPALDSEQTAAACVHDLLTAIFGGDLRDGVIAALKHLPLSRAELKRIGRAI